MSNGLIVILMAVTLGQAGGASQYGGGAVYTAPDSTQAFGTGEPMYQYDAEQPWVHGYWQEIPAYGGFHFFRPYNYKHVFAQSQTAAAWGMSPNLPYSHEYFRRIYDEHALSKEQQKTSSYLQGDAQSRELVQRDTAIRAWGPTPTIASATGRRVSRPAQTYTTPRTASRGYAQDYPGQYSAPAATGPQWTTGLPTNPSPEINPAGYQQQPPLTRAQELQLRMYLLQQEIAAEAQAAAAAQQQAGTVDPFLAQPRR